MATHQITYCEPHAAHGVLESEPHFSKHSLEVTFNGHGEATSKGLDWSDCNSETGSMHTVTYTAGTKWRRGTPSWMFHPEILREVIVRSVEHRAGIIKNPGPGTWEERLLRAQKQIDALRPNKIAALDALCDKFMAAKLAGEPTTLLAQQIEYFDTKIRIDEHPAAIITSILFLSYRVGMSSSGVAQEMRCVKPPMVRQTLFRCRAIADQVQGLRSLPCRSVVGRPPVGEVSRAAARQSRIAAGLCLKCGGRREEDRWKCCAACRRVNTENARRNKRLKQGLSEPHSSSSSAS